MGMHGAYCWLQQLLLAGGELHSLGSPRAGLNLMQGGILLLCILTPGTLNIGEKLDPTYWLCPPSLCQSLGCSGHYSQFHCPLSHSQWVSCRLGWFFQGHFYQCGSLGSCSVTTIKAPPMGSLPRATWHTRGIAALSSLGQGSHELGYLLS